ncbi:hypothetical protein DS2_15964 [Catenovulum agarivorans DS-2]|uniref:Uncharacterized protein n=1 Tax=Catenovulum agarivorans DS-2 TaxID=1328313 RepID=W7QTI7_9ALTE|nr:tetratricopeptide repeat protein [Catenovulum agarivorans]EWH08745.1 hypothetical protein DS2_15964 [Catenovulum agarivorans DS-2]
MSVINQMLKDLDSRQQQGQASAEQDYPQIPAQANKVTNNSRKIIWAVVALLLVIYALWMYWPDIQKQLEPTTTMAVPQQATSPKQQESSEAEPTAKIINANLIAPTHQNENTTTAPADKSLEQSSTSQQAVASVSAPTQSQRQASSPPTADVPTSADTPVEPVAKSNQTDKPSSEQPTQQAAQPSGKLRIQNTQKSAEEIAYSKFERAQDLLDSGQFIPAEQHILSALKLKPDFHQARILLVSIFYGGQNTAKALATLKQGIHQYPKHWDYYFIAGRILNEQNQLQAAWQVLESVPNSPEVAGYHTNMFQFKANLAQQLEYWQAAYQTWQTLLTLNPSHAKWHLGAAINAEKLGEKQLALKHYQTVANQGGVSTASLKFVENKIMELQP